jgi:hypothetical protein
LQRMTHRLLQFFFDIEQRRRRSFNISFFFRNSNAGIHTIMETKLIL